MLTFYCSCKKLWQLVTEHIFNIPNYKWPEVGLGSASFSDPGFTEKVNQASGSATGLLKGSSESLVPSSSSCWQIPLLWGFRIGDLSARAVLSS